MASKGPRVKEDAASAIVAPVPDAVAQPEAAPVPEASPSMAQFLEIKAANPDSLLWYRMGDFYELFFDDAVVASAALGIVLTKRGKHQGEDIPMCGVPIHRADEYLQRLIRLGYRVAVCRAARGPGGSQEARLQGRGAPRRRTPRHARHADGGCPARRQGAQLPHRAVPGSGPGRERRHGARCYGRARLGRHLDRRVRGGRGQGRRSAGRALPAGARRGDPASISCSAMRRSSAGSSTPAPRRRRSREPISTAWRARRTSRRSCEWPSSAASAPSRAPSSPQSQPC